MLLLFAAFSGGYFIFLFIFYFCWSTNIPIEIEIVLRHETFYKCIFYGSFVFIPLFLFFPIYLRVKKHINTIICILLIVLPVFAGWYLSQLIIPLLIERAPWESMSI